MSTEPIKQGTVENDSSVCAHIRIEGNVQGVGFRPFLFRLAKQHALQGNVRNSLQGVELEIEGSRSAVDAFLAELPHSAPPLALITNLSRSLGPPRGHDGFSIGESSFDGRCAAQIAPDVAVCDDCLREHFDPNDRRYLHPFVSCTNCGPRFTIIAALPYDRQATSMARFTMCAACQEECEDPDSRRFHCQTNACWKCGPKVWLQSADDPDGAKVGTSQLEMLRMAAKMLQQGAILAIKGVGGFHFACDASNAQAVEELRRRKRREAKPFALMVPDLEAAKRLCHVDEGAAQVLSSPARPITLLRRHDSQAIADAVACDHASLGLMLPYSPLHYSLLFDETQRARFQALVMTSGNRADEPIAIRNRDALAKLAQVADAFLLHDRDIVARADDSILRFDSWERSRNASTSVSRPKEVLIRRSRGYAPAPIRVTKDVGNVLSVGAHLKNSIAISRGNQVFLSQHIGDLNNLEAIGALEHTTQHLRHLLDVQPNIVAHDLHPDYLSTRYAEQLEDVRLVPVQHHHAHVASCIAEHGLTGPVIGVVLDGTGLGTDGHVWGGEILVANYEGFRRAAHLRELPMPGNEKAIEHPWRMALSYLYATFDDQMWELPISFISELSRTSAELVLQAARQGINSPITSSCGRLFDAVAALLGLRSVSHYEGQAAMELEAAAYRDRCHFGITDMSQSRQQYLASTQQQPTEFFDNTRPALILDQLPLIETVVCDLQKQLPIPEISRRFHQALSHLFAAGVGSVAEQTGITQVVLSGGCFQNAYLKHELTQTVGKLGLDVRSPERVAPNDGALALGQIMVASQTTKILEKN